MISSTIPHVKNDKLTVCFYLCAGHLADLLTTHLNSRRSLNEYCSGSAAVDPYKLGMTAGDKLLPGFMILMQQEISQSQSYSRALTDI